jgi:pyrroloquinoline quinone biosynthesis protein D
MSTPQEILAEARPRVAPMFRLQWEEVQSAWVLLYPEGMVKLNGSAGEIMRRCEGTRSTREIAAELEGQFGAADLLPDVVAFLEMARAQRWIEI